MISVKFIYKTVKYRENLSTCYCKSQHNHSKNKATSNLDVKNENSVFLLSEWQAQFE